MRFLGVRQMSRSLMTATKGDNQKSAQAWSIVALGLTVVGLLAWLGWVATRPDVSMR